MAIYRQLLSFQTIASLLHDGRDAVEPYKRVVTQVSTSDEHLDAWIYVVNNESSSRQRTRLNWITG